MSVAPFAERHSQPHIRKHIYFFSAIFSNQERKRLTSLWAGQLKPGDARVLKCCGNMRARAQKVISVSRCYYPFERPALVALFGCSLLVLLLFRLWGRGLLVLRLIVGFGLIFCERLSIVALFGRAFGRHLLNGCVGWRLRLAIDERI